MKKVITVLLLLSSTLLASAGSFQSYMSFINKAENYIILDDYKHAQAAYDSAFHMWDKPFSVDVFNALKCANLNADYPKVKTLAARLMHLGCELSFFYNPEYLRAFRCTKEWRALINEYAAIHLKYIKDNNWKLRTQIEQMLPIDQFLRQQDHIYTFLKDSIYKADDTMKTKLIAQLQHKFPNEYDYGVFLADDTTVVDYEPMYIVILHNYGKFDTSVVHNGNTSTYDFTQLLLKAVKRGEMHPEEFAQLNDRAGKFMTDGGYGQDAMLVKIKGMLYYEKPNSKVGPKIEGNRRSIGLCTREQGRAKLIYNKTANTHKFILRRSAFGIAFFGDDLLPQKVIDNSFINTGVSIDKL